MRRAVKSTADGQRTRNQQRLNASHIEETDTSFAVGWQGTYEITGTAFVFSHQESGRVMTILGYLTRHIVERISGVLGDDRHRQ